ncbi:SMC family ATPase [Candidatus Woesearchaeota archaeon]|nr:SMC family ATPase [Candidatus Woesearchaeota archaeon]
MIINSVKLTNIRSYSNATINFPNGCVLLSGDIGSGKSTVLLAIEFALFGLTNEIDGSTLLRNGKSTGEVELKLTIDQKETIIKRCLKRTRDSVRQDSGYVIDNGVKNEGTPIEIRARVLQMLGYPKELLTKSKSLIYRYTVYTPQEEMKIILQEDNQTRIDTLRKIFQIDKYRRIKENAQTLIKTIRERTRELDAKTEDILEKERMKSTMEKELEEAQAKLSAAKPELEKMEARLIEIKGKMGNLEKEGKMISECRKNIELANSMIHEKSISIRESKNEMIRLTNDAAHLKRVEEEAKHHLSKLIGMLATAKAEKEKAMQEISNKATIKQETRIQEEELEKIKAEIRRQQFIIELSKKITGNIHAIQTCPTCMQPVSPDHKEHITKIEEDKAEEANKKITEASKAKETIEQKITKLREKLEEIHEKEKHAAILTSEIESWEPEYFPAEAITCPLDMAEIRKISRIIREGKQTKERILDNERLLNSLADRIRATEKEIALLEKTIELENQKARSLEGIETRIAITKKDLDEALSQEKAALMQKAALETHKRSIEKSRELIMAELEKKKAAKKQSESLKANIHWLEDHFIGLTETIEKHTMLRIHQEFSTFFAEWFQVLMEEPSMSIRLDEQFTPVIEQNGYELSFENMSGGERTSCALAYRLALNKVINDLITNIRTKELIILDEPTDGFSSEQLERVRDVINRLKISQMIIVSHETKIESYADKVIRISKEDDSSSANWKDL